MVTNVEKTKSAVTAQLRIVDTPQGPITYTLERKRIKNLNLRIRHDRSVVLSIPIRGSVQYADEFIRSRSDWIYRSLERLKSTAVSELAPELPRDECVAILHNALEQVYPLVVPLGITMPELKVRRMRSQWGNCHWKQGYITLNLALARCPVELQHYVALHELVHFLEPNHGPGFYTYMDALMPDWRQRRRTLKQFVGALVEQ